MYWNVESATETQGSSSWIVTLDVLKYFWMDNNSSVSISWIVTLDVLKSIQIQIVELN